MNKVLTLAQCCSFYSGGTPAKENGVFWKGDIPWFSPKDVKSFKLASSQDHISLDAVKKSATKLVEKGTILVVSRSGVLAHTLPIGIVQQISAFNQDIRAIIPNKEFDPEYIALFLRAIQPLVLRHGVKIGATVHSLKSGYLEQLEVPKIELPKQRQLIRNLKTQLAEVETARNALECQKQEIVNLANAYIRESIEQSPNTVGAGLARDLDNVCDLNDAVTYSRARPAPTIGNTVIETRLGDVLEEVKKGIGANWADYPVLGATRNGLAPAKEPPGKYPQRYKPVFSGTVFYNPMRIMIGSIAFVDDDDESGITSPDYVALRGKAGVVDSRWFYYWLRSPYGVQCINSLARGAVRERMLFNRLAEGSILLPPYQEQLRVSKALAQLKPVKSGIQKQLDELNKIPERLLAQAFGNND